MIRVRNFFIIVIVGTVLCNDVISQQRRASGNDSKSKCPGHNRCSSALESSSVGRDVMNVSCHGDDLCRRANVRLRRRDVSDDEEEPEDCPKWKRLEDDEYMVFGNNSIFVKIWNDTLSPESYKVVDSSYFACDSKSYYETFSDCDTFPVELPQNMYIMLPNQSVFVPDWNKTFDQNKYQLIDSIVHVCYPFALPGADDGDDEAELAQDNYILPRCSNGADPTELNQTDYVMVANASVFVLRWNLTFKPGEYQHVRSKLYVCLPLVPRDIGKSVATLVGLVISLVSLLILFVIYMIFSELRNTPGKCVICLAVSLFVGQFSFCFTGFKGEFCFYLATIVHYSFLASFAWTSVLAFDICRTFLSHMTYSGGGTKSRRFLYYSAFAWGLPLVIVITCICLDFFLLDDVFSPGYGSGDFCWISRRTSLIIFFIVPLGASLVGNFVLFSVTVYRMCKSSRTSGKVLDQKNSKVEVFVCVKLSFIMGLTWVFAFLANFTQWTAMWYLFILFNTLQGAFLCLAFVGTKKVFRLMKQKKKGSISMSKKSTSETAAITVL